MARGRFDAEERWPELFEQLDVHQRYAVVQSLAAVRRDGGAPSREDVANLIDRARGAAGRSASDARGAG